MTNELIKLLRDNDERKIRHYIFEKELEFYGNKRINSVMLSKLTEEDHEKLVPILKIEDKNLIYSNEQDNLENELKIYKTNIYHLFLVKKEKFSELIFSKDIKKLMKVN